jgi:hypothetical protein
MDDWESVESECKVDRERTDGKASLPFVSNSLGDTDETQEDQPHGCEHVLNHVGAPEGDEGGVGEAHAQTQRDVEDEDCPHGRRVETRRCVEEEACCPLDGRQDFDTGPGAIYNEAASIAELVTRHDRKRSADLCRDMGVQLTGHHHRDHQCAVLGRRWLMLGLDAGDVDDTRTHPHDPGGEHYQYPLGCDKHKRQASTNEVTVVA